MLFSIMMLLAAAALTWSAKKWFREDRSPVTVWTQLSAFLTLGSALLACTAAVWWIGTGSSGAIVAIAVALGMQVAESFTDTIGDLMSLRGHRRT